MSESSTAPIIVQEQKPASSASSSTPDITATFLTSIANQKVNVKLFNDFLYTGELSSIDGFMNVVLLNASEIVNGKTMTTYEEVFLRGNNVIYISRA